MSIKFSEDCYLQDTCWKYMNDEKALCKTGNVFCPKFFRTDYLFEESLLSQKQRIHIPLRPDADGTDRDAFVKLKKIEESIENFVDNGQCLYIHSSTCGNGKTAWAIRMLQSYINKIWFKSDLRCRVLFVNVPRFILALKENITTPSEYVKHVQDNIETVDLVVFDEVGTKALTTFEHEHILNIINTRIDNDKSNIYTSNLSPMELREKVGDRLYSRIVNLSIDVELFGSDKRSLNV